MPIKSMLVSIAVVLVFLVFMVVLAWGDLQTRPARLEKQSDPHLGRRWTPKSRLINWISAQT